MKNLFLTARLYFACGAVITLFSLSFYFGGLFLIAQMFLVLFAGLVLADGVLLFRGGKSFECSRSLGKVFSLNDENPVSISVKSLFRFRIRLELIDELPYQLQIRDFKLQAALAPGETKLFRYSVVPKVRGRYEFGNIHAFVVSPLGLIQRRIIFDQPAAVPVYPSIVQMKKYQLHISASVKQYEGLKKIQRIGHSYEFDHIKNYVVGEDPRSINWKASSRRNELMINHFEDEKSQQVYCILNKSRLMKMSFEGLSLLDYSINTCLTISNIVLNKSDKIGLFSFSDKMGTVIKANHSSGQLRKILHALYSESESALDPNYELLYSAIRYFIPGRSLLFLFTNFETADSLARCLPLLRKINRFHLLVPVLFENAELVNFVQDTQVDRDIDIYHKVIARKMLSEKEFICSELKNHGIQYILTQPEHLSINTINKYLELKSRGLI